MCPNTSNLLTSIADEFLAGENIKLLNCCARKLEMQGYEEYHVETNILRFEARPHLELSRATGQERQPEAKKRA